VGVPENVPEENVIPVGSTPITVHVYGAVPPDAPSDETYALSTMAGGKEVFVMAIGVVTETANGLDVLCPLVSLACTVNE
jgi:hypothetical protein